MNIWLKTFGPTGLSLLFNERFIRTLQSAFNTVKRGCTFLVGYMKRVTAVAAGYAAAKLLAYYIRFFVPKEEATKLVLILVIGYIFSKVMEEMPKSEPSADGRPEWPTWA